MECLGVLEGTPRHWPLLPGKARGACFFSQAGEHLAESGLLLEINVKSHADLSDVDHELQVFTKLVTALTKPSGSSYMGM